MNKQAQPTATSERHQATWLHQFQVVKQGARIFLILTWLLLIGYEYYYGWNLIEGLKMVILAMITWELWTIDPTEPTSKS